MSGFVYFIGWEGSKWVKIGFTKDVRSRLRILTCGTPFDLRVEAFIPCEARDERLLHRALRPHRHNREWFERDCIVDELIAKAIQGLTVGEVCAWLPERKAIYQRRIAEFYDPQIIHEAEGLRAA